MCATIVAKPNAGLRGYFNETKSWIGRLLSAGAEWGERTEAWERQEAASKSLEKGPAIQELSGDGGASHEMFTSPLRIA